MYHMMPCLHCTFQWELLTDTDHSQLLDYELFDYQNSE